MCDGHEFLSTHVVLDVLYIAELLELLGIDSLICKWMSVSVR